MDSLVTPNGHYRYLEELYQLNKPEQAYSLAHVAVGVGLKYIIESVKQDAPNAKINRVVKDEVREVAGVSISSLDKYLGEAFQSERQIDTSTLDKLSINLFYQQNELGDECVSVDNFKYLQSGHIGILGRFDNQQAPKQFISDLISFIKTKPLLLRFIQDELEQSKHPQMIARVFELNKAVAAEPGHAITFNSSSAAKAELSDSKIPIIAATAVLMLGVSLPALVLTKTSANPLLVLDYLVHDPGKHLFHIAIFPCMVWAFLSCVSVKRLREHKTLFLVLLAAGFILSASQTYIQHAQSVCDLMVSDYACSGIADTLFNEVALDRLYFLFSSFLSLISSLFNITIFVCLLVELRNKGREICSPLIYSAMNISVMVWAVARSYSEWHEVALSFEAKAIGDFAFYQYQSFLMIITTLVISQILILLRVGRNRLMLIYLGVFITMDIISFAIATNIQYIAPKLHSFNHLDFENMSNASVIIGPLVYSYFLTMMTIFTFATIVRNVRRNSSGD